MASKKEYKHGNWYLLSEHGIPDREDMPDNFSGYCHIKHGYGSDVARLTFNRCFCVDGMEFSSEVKQWSPIMVPE